jgi:hypothetical protein
LQEHIDEAQSGGQSLKCIWIRGLIATGDAVQMKIVDQCPADDLADLESWWINELEWQGCHLFNGNGGVRGSKIDEVALRVSIADHKRKQRKPKSIGPIGPVPSDDEFARYRVAYEAVASRLGRSPTKVEVAREMGAE